MRAASHVVVGFKNGLFIAGNKKKREKSAALFGFASDELLPNKEIYSEQH